jgi:PhnB protein
MAVTMINPYLFYNGTAAKALELYRTALGARTVGDVAKFGDAPGTAAGDADRVMHAMLDISGQTIMLSDTMSQQPVAEGGNVQVCLNFDDVDETNQKFAALSAGGKVTMPLADTFWGARFGTLTDAFGVQWMFNCQLKK